jgi:hypothetical protein
MSLKIKNLESEILMHEDKFNKLLGLKKEEISLLNFRSE